MDDEVDMKYHELRPGDVLYDDRFVPTLVQCWFLLSVCRLSTAVGYIKLTWLKTAVHDTGVVCTGVFVEAHVPSHSPVIEVWQAQDA